MASPQSGISNGNLADAEKLPTTFYLGLVVYLVSFFLPAVEQPSPMSGWMCAYLSLWAWLNKPLWMCFFAGIINPLAIAFVVLRHRNRAPKTRRVIALAVLACIPITWLFLSDMELGIRVGHVVWIAGLLLILFPARTLWPTVRDAPWLTVPPLLVLIWWGLRATTIYPLQPPTDRDIFIYEVAIQFKDPNLCQKIPPYAEGNGSGERPGYEISYLQSGCYFELAGALHDQSLCDKVKPISKGMRDGSKYTPESCREYRGYSGSGIVSPHTVTTWMRQLGYTDQDLHHFQYRAVFNNPMYEAYDRFRKDGQFSERLRAAPSFAEPVAVDKSRAPNDLEYLYGMLAVDAYDSTFCDKISGNAVVRRLSPQAVPMRVECYHDVALNKLDLAACGKLPTRINLPRGTPDSESRETCSHDVAAMRSSLEMIRQPLKGVRSGPVFPPTFESFQSALHDLGYDVDLPRPTDSDYEDFLTYLQRDNPSGRAEFLRRVAALK